MEFTNNLGAKLSLEIIKQKWVPLFEAQSEMLAPCSSKRGCSSTVGSFRKDVIWIAELPSKDILKIPAGWSFEYISKYLSQ